MEQQARLVSSRCIRGALWFGIRASFPIKGIQDSPWIPDPGAGFQSSSHQSVWILIVSRIPDSLSCIPDSKSQDSKFHKQKFPRFRNPAWIQDSNCYWDSGFLELYSGFQSPGFRIPQQKFPTFWNVDSLIGRGRPVNTLPFKVTKLVSRSARSLKADFVQRNANSLS